MAASLFCDTCGAEITVQMQRCSVCGRNIDLSSTPPDTASGATGLLAGRYRLIDEIGQGGFGLLYKAQDTAQRDRLVAIKQINMSALSAQEKIEATDSYNREVLYLSKLQHKNLPHFYDHFTDPDHWYVVMEYIEGETLEEILKKTPGSRFPLQQVLAIGITLCDVLQYLHQQNPPIIFRDMKPGNIMMTPRGHLYLIDFGIARSYHPEKTKDTGALGSPGYAAPEQYGRTQTTAQTDLYGLGATLQTLLTGMEPLELALDGMPADLYLPKCLRNLLARTMEREAGKRPKNASEVKSDLRRLRGLTLWNAIQFAFSSIGVLAILVILAVRSSIISSGDWTIILALNLLLIVPYMAWLLYKIAKEGRHGCAGNLARPEETADKFVFRGGVDCPGRHLHLCAPTPVSRQRDAFRPVRGRLPYADRAERYHRDMHRCLYCGYLCDRPCNRIHEQSLEKSFAEGIRVAPQRASTGPGPAAGAAAPLNRRCV